MDEQTVNKFTPEQKTEWWGEGEWVNEPDLVTFEYKGIECMVLRVAMEEPYAKDFHMFGGFLNGYVAIPANHPYWTKIYEDMDIDCHGGLTFGECSDRHWIGFDCAHSHDYVPSTEHMKKTAAWMKDCRDREKELKDKFLLHDSPIFNNTYKNIHFCMEECRSMAEQLVELGKK
jgi:hypothetical protein